MPMLLFYQVATRLSRHLQIVELQDDNKLLEQLVASLLSSYWHATCHLSTCHCQLAMLKVWADTGQLAIFILASIPNWQISVFSS
jgi:hypothetical protein